MRGSLRLAPIIEVSLSEPHMHSTVYYIRTTSDKVCMRQMFMASMLCPLRVCDRQKEKGSEIDASPQLPISTGVQSLDRSRLPWSVSLDRSRLPRSAIMAARVQSTDVFRVLGFLVCCATISRKLGQGRKWSVGSPLL